MTTKGYLDFSLADLLAKALTAKEYPRQDNPTEFCKHKHAEGTISLPVNYCHLQNLANDTAALLNTIDRLLKHTVEDSDSFTKLTNERYILETFLSSIEDMACVILSQVFTPLTRATPLGTLLFFKEWETVEGWQLARIKNPEAIMAPSVQEIFDTMSTKTVN